MTSSSFIYPQMSVAGSSNESI